VLPPHAQAVPHKSSAELRVAAPDGSASTAGDGAAAGGGVHWFSLEEANVQPQAALLAARQLQLCGLEGVAVKRAEGQAGSSLAGRMLAVKAEPVVQNSSGGANPRPRGGARDRGASAATNTAFSPNPSTQAAAAAAAVVLGPWAGCWPMLLPAHGASSATAAAAAAVYDPSQGLQQPGFIPGRNKLWQLEIRAPHAAAAAAAATGSKQQQQQGQQRQLASQGKRASAPPSWSSVAGGGGEGQDAAVALGMEEFPALQEVMGAGSQASTAAAALGLGVAKGEDANAQQKERERQAKIEAAWAAMAQQQAPVSGGGGVSSSSSSSGRGSGRGRGSGGGGGGAAAAGSEGRAEEEGELLATLWVGLEYECFEDGRRLIASPEDWGCSPAAAAAAAAAAGSAEATATGGRGSRAAAAAAGGGGGGRSGGRRGSTAAALHQAGAAAAAGGGVMAASTLAWLCAFGEWPLVIPQKEETGGSFQLVRLWLQAPDACTRFAVDPVITLGDPKSNWRLSLADGSCSIPSGVLCAVRLPCVYATPAPSSSGGLRAVDAAGGGVLPGWLVSGGGD